MVINRSIILGLGVILIILVISLLGVIGFYASIVSDKDSLIAAQNAQLVDKDGLVSSLNNTVSNMNSQLSQLDSQINQWAQQVIDTRYYIDQLVYNNSDLSNYITYLTDVLNLRRFDTWINFQTISQPASSFTNWTFSPSYAGYVRVDVHSSTTYTTYVQTNYAAFGVYYNNYTIVGSEGTVVFPVLPTNVEIMVGNTDLAIGATETVTVTYYY